MNMFTTTTSIYHIKLMENNAEAQIAATSVRLYISRLAALHYNKPFFQLNMRTDFAIEKLMEHNAESQKVVSVDWSVDATIRDSTNLSVGVPATATIHADRV